MQLSQKQKVFSDSFSNFVNLESILNIFKKNMNLIADVFSNLRPPKDVVIQISKKSRFRGPFDK